jgi:hypothetical protein
MLFSQAMPVPRWRRALRLRRAVTACVLRRLGPSALAVVAYMLLATLGETTVGWLEARVPCRVVGRRTADGLEPLRGDDRVAGGDRLVVDVQAADLGLVRLRLEGEAAGGP